MTRAAARLAGASDEPLDLADLLVALSPGQLRMLLDAIALRHQLPAPRAPERELLAAHGELGDPDGLAMRQPGTPDQQAWFAIPSQHGDHALEGSFTHPPRPGDHMCLRTGRRIGSQTRMADVGPNPPISAHTAARLGTIAIRFAIDANAPASAIEHTPLRLGILLR